MQQKGKLTRWDDEKGFGFITPSSGGRPIFVHISAFPRGRRPKLNERLGYSMGSDGRSRPRAERVTYLAGGVPMSRRARGMVVAAFLAVLLAAVELDRLPEIVAGAYLAVSVVSFFLYAIEPCRISLVGVRGFCRTALHSDGPLTVATFPGIVSCR